MKSIKRMATLILALCLVLALAAPAMAAETTYTITIQNSTAGHTYQAYQIFKGDLNEKTLSNIQWGSGVTEAGQTALGGAADAASKISDAETFANTISAYLQTPTESTYSETDKEYTISGLEAGYYLVKDKDGTLQGDDDAYTKYLVKVVADVTAAPKSSAASMTKKLKDTNDTNGRTTEWQDSADYDIGDTIPYQLLGTLAANVEAFDKYSVKFTDTMCEGLTFDPNSVHVKVKGEEISKEAYSVSAVATVSGDIKGTQVTFAIPDVKAYGATNSSQVEILYNATLNENAVIGSAGNPNVAYMEYSNNPYSDNDDVTVMDDELGKTPEDKCIVFTYQTVINKVNGDNQPLKGAEFKLEKKLKDGTTKVITAEKNSDGTTFTFKGLDDGDYILTETKTPSGYNSIEPITFTVSASHDVLSDDPALKSLSGDKKSGEISFTATMSDCSLTAAVVNQAGTVLPETGGMGTTLIYILGAAMMLGAGVVLVTRKRMN